MPSVHQSRIGRVALALSLLAASYGARPTAAATDRLPDLRMANLSTFSTETAGLERRLRFTTIMTNEGAGPLEVRGTRGALTEAHLRTRQAIYDTAGGVRLVNKPRPHGVRPGRARSLAHPGLMLYQLWSNNGVVRRGSKVGFCFFDSRRHDVRPDSIPARSAAELDRLDPGRLILLGGPQVINQAVASGLARYAAN